MPAFDINFINPSAYTGHGAGEEVHIASQITEIIAEWYVSLRNLAIVILLVVLVYSGIRIVISSSTDDRAKYKQKIMDWVIAMCLLFVMHYIMLFTVTMVDVINDTIGNDITSIPVSITDGEQFNTSLMGLVRLQTQYEDFTPKVTYMLLYIGLIIYTVKFSWIYMKRLITMMFLTIIAPLVAMTYPIDKMNDGKAQAFNAWLKEYIFTALLQPFHLIIYTVLVGAAIDVVKVNPIYAIMVIAFIGPAEKMLRKFFGFDKASTPGVLSQAGAMFGGAAAMNMLKRGAGHFIDKKASGGKDGNALRTKAVEDPNAPDGYEAFAGNNQIQNRNTQAVTNEHTAQKDKLSEKETQQRMLDAYDEKYGTDEYDPAEREAMAREMYRNSNEGMNYSEDEYAQILRDSGYEEKEIKQMVDEKYEKNTTPETNATVTSTPETNTPGANSNRSMLGRVGGLAAAPLKGTAKTIRNTWDNKFADKRWKGTAISAAKKTAKFAGKAAVAGTVGAIGVGMGIAGDDLEDVLKYGVAGTALGYASAPGMGRKIANTELGNNIRTEADIAVYGSKKKADQARQTQALRESGELRDFVREAFPDKKGNPLEGKELNKLEDRAIGHYNDGFTDEKELKKVMKLEDKIRKELQGNLPEEEVNEQARVMSETIGKIARDITPGKLSDEKYRNGKLDEFKKGISKANSSLSTKEVNANAQQMMDYIMQYYKKP